MLTSMMLALALTLGLAAGDTVAALKAEGAVLKAKGDARGALTAYEKAAGLAPHDAGLQDEVGFLWMVIGVKAQAIAHLERALALDPTFAPAHFHLGAAKWVAGDRESALESLSAAARYAPANFEYVSRYAGALSDLERFDEAAQTYAKARKLKPTDAATAYGHCQALQRTGDLLAATRACRTAVTLAPANADYRTRLGFLLVETRSPDAGLEQFRTILARDPANTTAAINVGYALLQKGDLEGAVAHYRALTQAHPDLAIAHYNLGLALKQKDELQPAIRAFEQAVALDPALAEAHYTMGVTTWQMGNFEQTVHEMRAAVDLRPDYGEAWYMLGTALKQKGDSQAAVDALRKAAALSPRDPGPRNTLAQALKALGDNEGAAAALAEGAQLKARREAEQTALFHTNTGLDLLKKGRSAEAKRQFELALQATPDSPTIRKYLDEAKRRTP